MTDNKVVEFPTVIANAVSDPETIEFVEKLLAEVKSGNVVAVAVATVYASGNTGTGWHRDAENSYSNNALFAAINDLQYRYADERQ